MKNIKSIHIIQTILSYANDKDDILKNKLFSYSKKYQKIFNIGLLEYQVKFFDKIRMNSFNSYYKYLCDPKSKYNFNKESGTDNIDYDSYNKDGKTELLKKDLLKYNINIDDFKNYVKN